MENRVVWHTAGGWRSSIEREAESSAKNRLRNDREITRFRVVGFHRHLNFEGVRASSHCLVMFTVNLKITEAIKERLCTQRTPSFVYLKRNSAFQAPESLKVNKVQVV